MKITFKQIEEILDESIVLLHKAHEKALTNENTKKAKAIDAKIEANNTVWQKLNTLFIKKATEFLSSENFLNSTLSNCEKSIPFSALSVKSKGRCQFEIAAHEGIDRLWAIAEIESKFNEFADCEEELLALYKEAKRFYAYAKKIKIEDEDQ